MRINLEQNRIIKILFVCHGNICRSPMAEFTMKELVRREGLSEHFAISSAAVSYEEEDNGIYPQAAAKLREKGIPFGTHSAHRITKAEAASADIILVMDGSNERLIRNIIGLIRNIIAPEDYCKVHLIMEFAGKPGQDVADPWYTRNFERSWQDIAVGCRGLLRTISARLAE